MDASRLTTPPPVLDIARELNARGFDAVLVGGAVRDWLLGKESVDWDLVTNAPTDEVRTLATGVDGVRSVYDVGERFGTLGISLEEGGRLEVSCYRPDALAAASPAGRFSIDAGHRDFTVNAIGVDLTTRTLLDPVGGQADLAARLLRAPGDPGERLAEDPLRVVRAARFAAELGFALEPGTASALASAAPELARIAVERIREELTKLLVAPHAPEGLEILRSSGALVIVLPEVAALDGVTQPTFHDLDVLAHTLHAVGLAPSTPVLRWATLLHDVGKGPTRTVEPDGRIRFFRHAQVGAEIAEQIAQRLRFSTADTRAVVHLVAEHMRLGDINFSNPRSVDRAVRKLDLCVDGKGERRLVSAEDAVALTLADFAATAHREEAPALQALLERAVADSRERGTQHAVVSPLSGAELMSAFDLKEGPQVGVAKDAIESAIEDGDLAPDDAEGAYAIAARALGYHLGESPTEPC